MAWGRAKSYDTRSMHITASDPPDDAFAQAYKEYKDAIFRHCYFHVFDRELALDFVQETFIKTWEYIAAGNDVENMRAFLYKVATNLVYNHTRKKKESSLEALMEGGFDPGEEDPALHRDRREEQYVLQVLARLREPFRTAVSLRYIEGLQPVEIAEITGEKVNTVSAHITRGLKQLRSHLAHE